MPHSKAYATTHMPYDAFAWVHAARVRDAARLPARCAPQAAAPPNAVLLLLMLPLSGRSTVTIEPSDPPAMPTGFRRPGVSPRPS